MSDLIAPRADGTLARYRWKAISGMQYAVDQERSEEVVANRADVPRGMPAAQRAWGVLASLVLVAGFVALVWLPWYTPIIGFFAAYALVRANKGSAADFIAQLSQEDPAFFTEMLQLGIIREKPERSSVTEISTILRLQREATNSEEIEWLVKAYGAALEAAAAAKSISCRRKLPARIQGEDQIRSSDRPSRNPRSSDARAAQSRIR
jgi:hypothetical protein